MKKLEMCSVAKGISELEIAYQMAVKKASGFDHEWKYGPPCLERRTRSSPTQSENDLPCKCRWVLPGEKASHPGSKGNHQHLMVSQEPD